MMITESLYPRTTPAQEQQLLNRMFAHSPKGIRTYGDFSKLAFSQGELSLYTKELAAVAAAHTTGCPYCIDIHVAKAKKEGASLEELLESVSVASSVSAYAVFANGANTIQAYRGSAEPDLYPRSNIDLLEQWESLDEAAYDSVYEYTHAALMEGRIPGKDKLLIAATCAQVIGNAYAIEYFTRLAKQQGVTLKEVAECAQIAIVLKAGVALAHSLNTLHAFERE